MALFTESVTAARVLRGDRSSATWEALLLAAERPFAERGMFAVSNRRVSDAANQGNAQREHVRLLGEVVFSRRRRGRARERRADRQR
jgi:hypothetical protein